MPRLNLPSLGDLKQIMLQPVVGGPDNQTCMVDGQLVNASVNHTVIDAAIPQLVVGDIVAAPSPHLRFCSGYSDQLGHLDDDIQFSVIVIVSLVSVTDEPLIM